MKPVLIIAAITAVYAAAVWWLVPYVFGAIDLIRV